jgi:hypothetical protein
MVGCRRQIAAESARSNFCRVEWQRYGLDGLLKAY